MSDRVQVAVGGRLYWAGRDLGGPPRIIKMDGIDIPGAILMRLLMFGGDAGKGATFGKVLAAGPYDFGPPVGVQTVVVCEKHIFHTFPADPPYNVQGANLHMVPALLAHFKL